MAISKELVDFEKKYKMMLKDINAYTKKNGDYKLNAIKTYIGRVKGSGLDLAESVGYAQDEGFKGAKINDYVKDKDVANSFKGYKRAFDELEEETSDLKAFSEHADATLDKLQRLLADLDKKVGKKPAPPLKKDYDTLAKPMAKQITELKSAALAYKTTPKEALDLVKNVDANLAALIKKAATMPRKPKQPLPKELEKGPFDKIVKSVKENEKKLKAGMKDCAGAVKSAAKDKAEKAYELAEEALAEIKDIADDLEKHAKSAKDAIRRAPHGGIIRDTQDLASRTARAGKAGLAKLAAALKKA